MQSNRIQIIRNKYKHIFLALEDYDKTRMLPFYKKRIDITLSVKTINKLRALKEKTGKSISQLIEERI